MKTQNHINIKRHHYTNIITNEFDKLLEGKKALTIIHGNAGTGKTHLFNSLIPFFYNNNATVIISKGMQHNRSTTPSISKVIDDIITKILLLPKDTYASVVKTYINALHKDLSQIIAVSPDAKKIFTHLTQGENNYMDTKKARDSFLKFLEVSSSIFYPLVLYFDDLQWCDELTINIINSIINESNIKTYLVLSYRTKEMIENALKLGEHALTTIKVCEFSSKETKRFLLKYGKEMNLCFSEISNQVHLLTDGNPFYIISLIDDLAQKHNKSKNITKISDAAISFNIDYIIKDKLSYLDEFHLKIVNTIACLGGQTHLEILIQAIGKDNLINHLAYLTDLGILVKKNNTYAIIHDIIHDYVYKNMSSEVKEALIKQLINRLLVTKDSQNISQAIVSLCMQIEKKELLSINKPVIRHVHKIAVIKKNMTALEQSLELFNLCEYLLTRYEMDSNWIEIQMDYMECLYISNHMAAAQKKYEFIKSVVDENWKIKLNMRYLKCFASSAHWEMVLKLGEEILKAHGHSLDKFYIPFGLLSFRRYYRQGNLNHLLNSQNLCDAKTLDVLYVLLSMFPAANRIDEARFTKIVLKLSLLTAKYSHSEYSGVGYACAIYVLYHVFKDFKTASKLQHETLSLLEKSKNNKAIAYSLIGTFTNHLSNSFYDTHTILEKAIQSGSIEQEYMYSNYAIIFSIITQYVMGTPLNQLRSYIHEVQKRTVRTDNYLTKYMCHIHLVNIDYMQNGKKLKIEIPQDRQALFDTVSLNYDMLKVHRLFIQGKIKKAYELAQAIEHKVDKHKGFILNDDFYFYSAIVRMNVYHSLNKKQRQKSHKIIKKHVKSFNTYAKQNNNSHKAKSLLLNAEYIDKIYGKQNNEKEYYRAMTFASSDNNIQLNAFANLLAAKKHGYNLNLSKFYALEASKLYRLWGAQYISAIIEKEFELEMRKSFDVVNSEEKETSFIYHVKMINTANEREMVDLLMNSLFNLGNIIRCTLLFEEQNDYHIYYDKNNCIGSELQSKKVNINHASNIHQGIIRYVFRTQQTISSTKTEPNMFIYDDYMQNNDIDIYCVPLFMHGIMMACIYIELSENQGFEQIQEIISIFTPNILSKKLTKETTKDIDKTIQSLPLTKRELEIAKLIIAGHSNKEISQRAFISEGTARNHISNIYYKLNVKSRIQATIKLHEMGIKK